MTRGLPDGFSPAAPAAGLLRRKLSSALFLFVVLATSQLAYTRQAQGLSSGALLIPRFAPGETVRYRMTVTVETRSRLEPMGTSATNADPLRIGYDIGWQLQAVEVAPDGSTWMRATIERLQIDSLPPPPKPSATEQHVGKAVAYRVSSEGRIEDVQAPPEWLEDGKPPAWLRSWLEQGNLSAAGIPLRPIQVGETWQDERDIEVPGLPRQRLRLQSTYLRNEESNGTPCAAIVTRFALSGAESRRERNTEGDWVTLGSRAEGGGSRLSCYHLANGRLLESSQSTEESFWVEVRRGTEKAGAPLVMLLETRTKIDSQLRVVY